MNEKKKTGGCYVEHHGPDCPVTKAVRDAGGLIIAKAGEEANGQKAGPSKVVTDNYREGFDRIFGKKAEVGEA